MTDRAATLDSSLRSPQTAAVHPNPAVDYFSNNTKNKPIQISH